MFKVSQEPVVQPDPMKVEQQRFENLIFEAKKTMQPLELLDYVIKLYGEQFVKANAEIARLKDANDQMFKIKQKVVIANREILEKNLELVRENEGLQARLKVMTDTLEKSARQQGR